VVVAGDGIFVFLVQRLGGFRFFAINAVVDEMVDGNLLYELRHAADVIGMVVGDENVVDLLDASEFGGFVDADGVTVGVVAPAGVDEERLLFRRDEESGLATFDVDEEDLESFLFAG